jgi:Rad3-related DNA helicase
VSPTDPPPSPTDSPVTGEVILSPSDHRSPEPDGAAVAPYDGPVGENWDRSALLPNGRRQCTAKSKRTGNRCRQWACTGTTVCRMHGGTTKQVKRAHQRRLLELVDPAIARIEKELNNGDSSSDRLRAAENILDRTGISRKVEMGTEDAQQLIMQRIVEIRQRSDEPLDLMIGDDVDLDE